MSSPPTYYWPPYHFLIHCATTASTKAASAVRFSRAPKRKPFVAPLTDVCCRYSAFQAASHGLHLIWKCHSLLSLACDGFEECLGLFWPWSTLLTMLLCINALHTACRYTRWWRRRHSLASTNSISPSAMFVEIVVPLNLPLLFVIPRTCLIGAYRSNTAVLDWNSFLVYLVYVVGGRQLLNCIMVCIPHLQLKLSWVSYCWVNIATGCLKAQMDEVSTVTSASKVLSSGTAQASQGIRPSAVG